jgi:hypothetical protein
LNIPTAVGCAAVDHCWVAMARYDTSNPDGTYSHPVIESTSDLGHTWTSVSVENTTPTVADVLALGCPPSGDGCLAIGNGQDHFVHPRGARSLSGPIILSNLPS